MYRIIPPFGALLNTDSQTKRLRAVEKQLNFTKNVKVVKTWQFTSLDYKTEALDLTLRKMIAEIMWEDKTDTPRPLFLAADQAYNKDGFNFMVHPAMEPEARVVTAGLYPFLRGKYGDHVSAYFTENTVSSHQGHKWNAEKGGIVTEEDDLVAESDNEDDWMDLGPDVDTTAPQTEENLLVLSTSAQQTEVHNGIMETDSVGTIRTQNSHLT